MLALGYGCGLRAGEIVRLRAGDIDRAQMIIRIVQSKGRKDRHVMLPPEVLSLLRQWWKARPTRYDAGVPSQERWLFPGRRPGLHLTSAACSMRRLQLPASRSASACIPCATALPRICSRAASRARPRSSAACTSARGRGVSPSLLHRRCSSSRDFVPWRFSDACPQRVWMGRHAGVREPAQKRSSVDSAGRLTSAQPMTAFHLAPVAQGIDQQAERGRELPAARIVQVVT